MTQPPRVYVDTSVFGGCFEIEFQLHSTKLFEWAGVGKLTVLVSDVVTVEIQRAPAHVQSVLRSIPTRMIEFLPLSDEVLMLRDAYLAARVVSTRWIDDATHVAFATMARADAIVSWNFKHIVRLDKIKAYNQVNSTMGYGHLTILSPREVMGDESESES